jgi:SAM-dependent methyltransferase
MSFDVAAEAYGRFMGRFSEPLADQFVDLVEPIHGQRALDVGCGPGAMTERLVARLGTPAVSAIDPSASFVEAATTRLPGVDVRRADAEELPYPDATFDLTVAQLVVHFMSDPPAAAREMSRVTRPGGLVAASVWDYGGGRDPLATFWCAVREMDPAVPGEAALFGARQGQVAALLADTGLSDVGELTLTVRLTCATFDQWWEPFTLGVGPAGSHYASLDETARDELRSRCAALQPEAPFDVSATAWVALGRVPG